MTQQNQSQGVAKVPIYKQKWFWIVIGVLVVFGVIYNAVHGPTDTTPSASPTASIPMSASTIDTPASTAVAPPVETPSPSQVTSSPPPAVTVAQVEKFLKESYSLFNNEPWTTLCTMDSGYDPYPCTITSITLEGRSLYIQLQAQLSKADAQKYAGYAFNFLCATQESTAAFRIISDITLTDASGVDRGFAFASENFLCKKNA